MVENKGVRETDKSADGHDIIYGRGTERLLVLCNQRMHACSYCTAQKKSIVSSIINREFECGGHTLCRSLYGPSLFRLLPS